MNASLARSTRGLCFPTLAQATLIVLVSGLAWRTIRYCLAFPLWGDEAYVAVNFVTRDLAGLARPLEYFQIAPPGFLWAEWLAVSLFGTGERALRLVPFLAGLASLPLFWRFCREVTSRRTTLLAVAMLAASFYPVRHATEVKPYAIDLLVALVLLAAGWRVVRDVRSRRAWLALGAAAVIGVWCSYTAVFPVAAVALVVGAAITRQPSSLSATAWLAVVLSAALNWVIMFATFAQTQTRAAEFLPQLETWKGAFPPLAAPWRLPWWLVEVHTGNMAAYPYGGNNGGSALTTLLVVAGCVRMATRPVRRPLLFLLLAPLPVALAAAALHRYPYGTSTRVMLYMAPAFCLLSAEGMMALFQLRHWARRGPLILAGILAIVPLVCAGFNVAMPYKAYDDVLHRGVARWLAERTRAGDQWVVFDGATPLPRLKDLMVQPWLQRVGEARFYLLKYAPVRVRWQPDPRTVAPSPTGRTWLIIQNHGDAAFFPAHDLALYEQALEVRLGPPLRQTRFSLPRNETWSIREYGPGPSSLRGLVEPVAGLLVAPPDRGARASVRCP